MVAKNDKRVESFELLKFSLFDENAHGNNFFGTYEIVRGLFSNYQSPHLRNFLNLREDIAMGHLMIFNYLKDIISSFSSFYRQKTAI